MIDALVPAMQGDDLASIREALRELVGDDVRIVHARGCDVTGTDSSGLAAARAAALQFEQSYVRSLIDMVEMVAWM
jgi:hypothetical protein